LNRRIFAFFGNSIVQFRKIVGYSHFSAFFNDSASLQPRLHLPEISRRLKTGAGPLMRTRWRQHVGAGVPTPTR